MTNFRSGPPAVPTNPQLIKHQEEVIRRYKTMEPLKDIARDLDIPFTTLTGHLNRQRSRGLLKHRGKIDKGRGRARKPPRQVYREEMAKSSLKCGECGVRLDYYDHPVDRMIVPEGERGLCGWCVETASLWLRELLGRLLGDRYE